MISFTPRPPYPQMIPGTHWTGWVGPRAGLERCEKKFRTPVGNRAAAVQTVAFLVLTELSLPN
jgi:hypothetical protein